MAHPSLMWWPPSYYRVFALNRTKSIGGAEWEEREQSERRNFLANTSLLVLARQGRPRPCEKKAEGERAREEGTEGVVVMQFRSRSPSTQGGYI